MSHRLEALFGLTAHEILDVIVANNRCLMNIKGAVAQEHLRRYLAQMKTEGKIDDYASTDVDGKPDFKIRYKGLVLFLECKNVQKALQGKNTKMTVDFWRTRYQKTGKSITRFYHQDDFHILAACQFNRTGKWEFVFIPTSVLPIHPEDKERFYNRVALEVETDYGTHWAKELDVVLATFV